MFDGVERFGKELEKFTQARDAAMRREREANEWAALDQLISPASRDAAAYAASSSAFDSAGVHASGGGGGGHDGGRRRKGGGGGGSSAGSVVSTASAGTAASSIGAPPSSTTVGRARAAATQRHVAAGVALRRIVAGRQRSDRIVQDWCGAYSREQVSRLHLRARVQSSVVRRATSNKRIITACFFGANDSSPR